MTYKTSICSKHDDCMKLLKRLSLNYSSVVSNIQFEDDIVEIIDLIEDAKTDGQKMENGLDKKRDRIDELERENQVYLEEISDYEIKTKELEAEIKKLENQLEDNKITK